MLIQCPECKKEVSLESKSCPHCGHVYNPSNNKRILSYIVIGIVAVLGFAIFISSEPSSTSPVVHNSWYAKNGAETLVKEILKSPSTAKILNVEILDTKRDFNIRETKYLVYVKAAV